MAQRNGETQGSQRDGAASPFVSAFEGAKITSLRQKRWGGVGIQVKEQRFSTPFQADLHSDHARFSVVLDLVGDQPEARNSRSRPTVFSENTMHQMNFAPADCPVWACSDGTKYFRTLSLYFRNDGVDFLDEEKIDPGKLFVPRLMFFDPAMLHIARLLELECESNDPVNDLYLETLTLAFLLRLSDLERSRPERQARGGLAAYQLRRVTDYLCEHLAESVSLQELATITGLSRSYFSSAFRQSTGMSAHQWLLQKRISKAKEYLLGTDFPVAHIAIAVGFSDQAHFTRTFSRVVGTSPVIWRRARMH